MLLIKTLQIRFYSSGNKVLKNSCLNWKEFSRVSILTYLYCWTVFCWERAGSAGDIAAQRSPREGPHREVDGEVARNATNPAGTESSRTQEERTRRGAGLGHAAPRGDRRQPAVHRRHALPPQGESIFADNIRSNYYTMSKCEGHLLHGKDSQVMVWRINIWLRNLLLVILFSYLTKPSAYSANQRNQN